MPTVNPDQPIGLAPHVRACASDGQVILLDLKASAYLGVAQCAVLANRVQGWPRRPDGLRDANPSDLAERTLVSLFERGLVTNTPAQRSQDPAVAEVTSTLDVQDNASNSVIGACRLARFLRSAAETTVWLRCRSLEAIAVAVRRRRDRLQPTVDSCSFEAVKRGAAAYERLRPFVFSAHRNCLHDSLALVSFLAAEGAFPRWVIGVKTRPFGAHSWVQMGTTVVNDQHEMVRQFRPILVV